MKMLSRLSITLLIVAFSMSVSTITPAARAVAQDAVAPLKAWPGTLSEPVAAVIPVNLHMAVTGGIEPYSFSIVAQPSKGHVTLSNDGVLSYAWDPASKGVFTITYKVTDSQNPPASAIGLIEVWIETNYIPETTVTVTGDPRFPVTGYAAFPGYSDLTYDLETGPAHGTLNLAADGSFIYVATDRAIESDTFTVTTRTQNGGPFRLTVELDLRIDKSVPTYGTVEPGTGKGSDGEDPAGVDPRAPAPGTTPTPDDSDEPDESETCQRCN